MRGAQVSQLLDEVAKLPKLQQKKVGCLVGAAVADAAARPLHWVYDLADLNKYIKNDPQHPEFLPQSRSPFYTLPTGENSCYWDQAAAVMTSLNNCREFKFEDVCKEFVKQFGPSSVYNMDKRQEYMKRRMFGMSLTPLEGKWLHGGMIKFLENFSQGDVTGDAHVKETDGFCCSLPLVVKYAGDPGLVDMVTQVTSTQSTWPVAVSHAIAASKIVEAFILDQDNPIEHAVNEVSSDFPHIKKELENIQSNLTVDHTKAVGYIFGRPCYNPGSWMGAIHAVLSSTSYEDAVRKTILAGGCNCSRSFFIGAMLGAKNGVEGIPREWMEKTTNLGSILELAINISK